MNHRSVVIWGSLAVFVSVSALIVYMDTRKPPRPELTWDARFIESSNDYGVRFREEKGAPAESAKLPPMEVRALSQAELTKSFGSSTSEKSAFEIVGVNSNSGRKVIPGEPEPPVDCAQPIVFSDGSEARLKVIVGMDDGLNCDCGTRFAWAMTPEGKPLTKDEAKSLGWPGDGGGSWPTLPQMIQYVFELKGDLRLRESGLLEVESGHTTSSGITYGSSGSRQLLSASVARWEAGAKELIFIAYHGPLKSVDLSTAAGSEADLDGMPVRHLGAFTAFTGRGSGHWWRHGNAYLSLSGKTTERLHFIQLPGGTQADGVSVTDANGGALNGRQSWGGVHSFSQSPDAPSDVVRISKFSGVRRIRMRLPEFPASHAAPRIKDPLDRPIPAHWDKAGIKLRAALPLITGLSVNHYWRGSSDPFERELAEFRGGTLREILAEALAAALRAGAVVEIDRAKRTLVVKEPEPGWFSRLTTWCRTTARRLGL